MTAHVFHGRRSGRRLNVERKAALADLLPQAGIVLPEDGPLDPASLFTHGPQDIRLEIGFGNGEHLLAQALAHQSSGFIGCEPYINGVSALLKDMKANPPGNIRIFGDDTRPLLDALVPSSISQVFILFSDPWPKTRHARRRVLGPENLDRLARVMKNGAELLLATDVPDLFVWMFEHGFRHPDFEWIPATTAEMHTHPEDGPITRYEAKALARGARPVYFRFRRR
ncbi:MAG: tRNA (guanine(46)-N(7))-methyltransferase TrmB [Pseudomonadota bacterium]|nr:tRNA (guanine(46)-N(7))-methyltransferase TrmB [Pseudomonadota bacterium]